MPRDTDQREYLKEMFGERSRSTSGSRIAFMCADDGDEPENAPGALRSWSV